MADQFTKNHEFLDEDFDVFKQDEIEPQYQNTDPAQGIGINNYGNNMLYMERPKNLSIVENIHMQQMQQAHKTIVDYSDDEEQDDNYRVIKNMTIHYQTQLDQDPAEEQWNAQNENQVDEFQDDIKFQILHSGDVNMGKNEAVSAETMINKYQHTSSNSGFSASNSQTKEQQNGNQIPSTKGKTMMGSSIIAGVGAPIDQNGSTQNQQQIVQNQQKQVQSSQSLQGSKQGFKIINKEKSNLLSNSTNLQQKSMTNIDSQQIGGGSIVNSNNNSQFLSQIPQQNLNSSDFRVNLINNNNLLSSINGLDNSGLLVNSINNGITLRNPAQSLNFQENNAYYNNKTGFKPNQNYLGSSLISHQQEQILQDSQQFAQQDQQQIQQSVIQQQQSDNHILNKVKSEDCSSTNEQPITSNNVVNSTNNNNQSATIPLNGNSINISAAPQIPNQIVTPPHQTPPQVLNNNSGHIFNKQMKGSNVSTAEIKKPIKKVDVVLNNQNQIGMIHGQQHQQQQQLLSAPPPQQIHPQFQQNFLNTLNYQNPNQPPPQPQQQQYGYPYNQAPQAQPQPQYNQQQPPKNYLPPHYGGNPHLPQYNQYIEQPHQQNLLAPTLPNPYSQELDYMQYGSFLPPQAGGPQQAPPPQPQNGYSDYMQTGFNGMPYNAYNQAYPQHQAAANQAHQNAVAAAVHQQHHLFPHLPQINQPNGFTQGFPLNLRGAATNLAGSNHEMTSSPFNTVQNAQNPQISQFKIKEEAQPKGIDDKNSSSSQNNNNGFQNGNMIPQQNLNSSNQMAAALNGQQNQNNIQNQYNLLQGPNQYPQMLLQNKQQQLLQFQQDGMNGQGGISDSIHQANNALKLAQGQTFLNAQLNQFNPQHQQQQFFKQNQFMQQQQQQQQQQQLKQSQQAPMMNNNNNIEEESRDGEDEEDDIANSDGLGDQEGGNTNGKPKRPKNETKNIPKNYAKAFLRYIIDKDRIDEMKKILKQIDTSLEYDDIKKEAKNFKKNMNAIKDVRKIWQDDTNDRTRSISKFMRIASHQFLQKEAISYIFSSNKIKNSKSHIIYRHVMGLAMADPEKFNNIKSLYKNAYQD